MTEQQLVVVSIVAAIVVVVAVLLLLGKSSSTHKSSSSGSDPGGTFGEDVTDITPGIFNPGTAPPPTYEVTDHVRRYDDKPKKE